MTSITTNLRFLVRGGPTAAAQADTPKARELLLDTTTGELRYGDGAARGGLPLTVGAPNAPRHIANRAYVDAGLAGRALLAHAHARADLPWITESGASLLTAGTAAAQRTALGLTGWATNPFSDGSTSDIPEGARLYFTADRADARIAVQKGQAAGLAPLGSDGKVPSAYLPDSIVGQVIYKGLWDASTNTPALPAASVAQGYYYITSAAGTYSGIDYEVGDWCISDGTAWGKVDNSDAITSFAGRVGAILPIASDYSSFYLGISAQAADSAKFGGQLPSYFAQAVHAHTFTSLTSTPTTLAGYGITDAAAAIHVHTLDSLSNTTITSVASGEVLRYNGTVWVNATLAEAGIQAAGSYLTTTGTAADSAKLGGVAAASFSQTSHTHAFTSLTSKPTTLVGYGITDAAAASHAHTLDSLSNTTITSVASGEVLRYNGTAWVNSTLVEAGIQSSSGAASFSTLTTSDLTTISNGRLNMGVAGASSYTRIAMFSAGSGGAANGYDVRLLCQGGSTSGVAGGGTLNIHASGVLINAAFGCNGATPQTAYSVGAQVTGTTGGNGTFYGWSTGATPAAVLAQLAAIRTALINCGIAVT